MNDAAFARSAWVRSIWRFVAVAVALFIVRYVLRAHLAPQMDQECHIGGIAHELLAHGIRFPLMAYAPNEYDNGSFYDGILAAGLFRVFGERLLVVKLVTHLFASAGIVATVDLYERARDELGWTERRERLASATFVVFALLFAPRVVNIYSMHAVGNHPEGTALDMIVLALFARRGDKPSLRRVAALWAVAGFALYLNKGSALAVAVVGIAELVRSERRIGRLAAAAAGFAVGILPEVLVLISRHGMGWLRISSKAEQNSATFPRAFLQSLWTLAETRIELVALWLASISIVVAALAAAHRQGRSPFVARFSPAACLVLGYGALHLCALTVMAKQGLDAYVIYGFPSIAIITALALAGVTRAIVTRFGAETGSRAAIAITLLAMIAMRPAAVTPTFSRVRSFWNNRDGAACSWRFAEGFGREFDHGVAAPGRTRDQHVIWRCRSLAGENQVADCIGGLARELHWRVRGQVHGSPPAGLERFEQESYAVGYGSHRRGDTTACRDFEDPLLRHDCVIAVQLDCLVFADIYTGYASGRNLGPARCAIPRPPANGYWSALRDDLVDRPAGGSPDLSRARGDDDLNQCRAVLTDCYAPAR